VVEIDTASYVAEAGRPVAPRPANSALDLGKARDLGVPLLDWRTSVADYVETIV
jgi:dTDP-4-dehydrorhamnose 3,5-epimerase